METPIIIIWKIEEYAINIFWSFWFIIINKLIIRPNSITTFIKNKNLDEKNLIREVKRIKPKIPIFSIIVDNKIDPITIDSTWAFGSHKWKK